MSSAVTIEVVDTATNEMVASLNSLIPQLSSSAAAFTFANLQEIVESTTTKLFVAREGDTVIGTLTFAIFRVPSGQCAWIEDVIVDESGRGLGVGEQLVRAALDHAQEMGIRRVDLTSRPGREAANRLYVRLGFVQRETNVYRFSFETESP